MKQTAVEWFIENLPIRFKNAILNECGEEIEKAKAMEKEQIINAHGRGTVEHSGFPSPMTSEEYYDKTYNK